MTRTNATLLGAIGRSMELEDARLTETRYRPGELLPRHQHEMPMFVLVLRGEFDERYGSRDRSCSRYDLIFRPAGEAHSDRFRTRGGACLTIELNGLKFSSELTHADGRIALQGKPALFAMKVYDEMHWQSDEKLLGIEESIALLIDAAAARQWRKERTLPLWLDRTREAIHSSLPGCLRLSDLASNGGVHRVHLSRTFQQFYGCTVAEYVRGLRVHRACEQLRSTRATVSSVAFDNGFSDESHMGRTFRQIMGCTPRGYRPD